ncbi:MAG TPA: erythromycin esterase family protein [Hymenobacter sp.]|uniref:erythromycin esterase family protein n=1 Tax=Hymenobacter sp. TaxID=1898978 RepID=UPI002D7E9061|nr:erythromycin esterase family protein [Hymenobacter sp.]HET9504527.1 erythromycin esterase family protein [Hymenobacter sp.]
MNLLHYPKKLALLLLLLSSLGGPRARAQAPALPIQCLPAGPQTSYAPLRQALRGVRVVMLGEQTHADGTTFEAKVDLIRYLHDSLGYNTLAFEGDMYALDKGRRELAAGKPALAVLQNCVYQRIWSGTAEFAGLADYLHTHPRLRLAGFDCQQSGEYTEEMLLPELRAFLAQDPRTRWAETDFYPAKELLAELSQGDFGQQARHAADTVRLTRWLTRARGSLNYLATHAPRQAERVAFWRQWLRSAEGTMRNALAAHHGQVRPVQNGRDALMADNLLYLARQPEHPKIIVWAASFHLANRLLTADLNDPTTDRYVRHMAKAQRQDSTSAREMLTGAVPMGQLVKAQLGAAVYALGFVAYTGTYGQVGNAASLHEVLPPPPASAEAAFSQRGCEWGFANLRGTAGRYYAAPMGYLPLRAPWADIFDGLFFTRTMHPTTPLKGVGVAPAPVGGRQLRGEVRDAKTDQPLAFASVGLRGTPGGTVTNERGAFVLFVPADRARDTVQITSLGYGAARLPVARVGASELLRVRLAPQAHLLGTVEVRAPISVETIVRRVGERLAANYPQQAHSMQLYTRSQYLRDSVLQVQQEAALDFYDQEGYRRGSWEHASKNRFLQLRQQRRAGDSTSVDFKNPPLYWLLWSDDPVLTTRNPLESSVFKKYQYTLKGQAQLGDRTVYEVGFVCLSPSAFTTPYAYPAPDAFEGTLYVDTDNFALVKYEAFTTRRPHEYDKPKDFRRLGFAEPVTMYRRHHDTYQYEASKGIYFLKYARRENSATYLGATTHEKHRTREINELLTTSVSLTQPQVLQTSIYEVDAHAPYRPEFWDTYQVVLPTAAP